MYYPQKILTVSRIKPLVYPDRVTRITGRLPAGQAYTAGQIFYETVAAANCVQTLTFSGTITGGTFTLLFANQIGYDAVGPIAWSGTAATLLANIQAALNNYFGPGQVVVTGTGPYTLTYSGNLVTDLDIATPSVVNTLTGTGTPSVVAAQSTQGSGGIGFYEPYTAGSNTGVSYAILESNTKTAADGTKLDEHGSTGEQTFELLASGIYLASQLTGLDTNLFPASGAFGAMGKFRSGGWNTYPTLYPGSVVLIPGP